jgi:hypothetical protein
LDKDTTDAIEKFAAWMGIASFAGFVSYLQRFLQDSPPPFSWFQALIKTFTAGFVGLLTGWLLTGWNVPQTFVWFAMGVAGYGGGETIVFFQQVLQDSINRYARKDSDRS